MKIISRSFILLILTLCLSSGAYSKELSYGGTPLIGSNVNPTTNYVPTITVNTPVSGGSYYTDKNVDGAAIFMFDPASDYCIPTQPNTKYIITLNYKLVFTTGPDQLGSLSLEYDNTPGNAFKNIDVVKFSGKYSFTLTVLNLTVLQVSGPTNTLTVNDVLPKLKLDATLKIDRFFNFYSSNGSITNKPGMLANASDGKDLEIKWTVPTDGTNTREPEYYDVEWMFVNDYDLSPVNVIQYTPANTLNFDFANANTTRVRVGGIYTSFKVPILFEHGYVLYRVRAIWKASPDFVEVLTGQWSGNITSGLVSNFGDKLQIDDVLAHESDAMNWQAIFSFAEDGKNKGIVTYYDGTMRKRQVVTRVSSENITIVGETIYDDAGRPAVEVLPVPGPDNKFAYTPGFNKNNATTPVAYSYTDFIAANTSACHPAPVAMSKTSGASKYYSDQNPLLSSNIGFNANIPDAGGYPFTLTEYTPDNTGRIRTQSGVGPVHRTGTGHETIYYYGTPYQKELNRLFGLEVGNSEHYKKNMVIDANGQRSVSYIDPKGNVIATALVKNETGTVTDQTLSDVSENEVFNTITVKLLEHNTISKEQNALVSDYTFVVSTPGDYSIYYSVTGKQTSTGCSTNVCHNCAYKLTVRITDACGQVVSPVSGFTAFPNKQAIGSLDAANATCDAGGNGLFAGLSTKVTLSAGTYTISKILQVDEDIIDAYVERDLKDPALTCFKKYSAFEQEELDKVVDLKQNCSLTNENRPCEECAYKLGSYNDYDDVTSSNYMTIQDYEEQLARCQALCTDDGNADNIDVCDIAYSALLNDVSPGGQYGGYLDTLTNKLVVEISNNTVYPESVSNTYYPLSVFATGNRLPYCTPWTTTTLNTPPSWKKPYIPYRDEDGSPSYIILSDNGPQYSGTVVTLPSGQKAVLPDQLSYVKDFIALWKPSWAKSLVYYHPEYGYYNWCSENSLSNDFDAKLREMTRADAISNGYVTLSSGNYVGAVYSKDPYFQFGKGSTTSTQSLMTAKLNGYLTVSSISYSAEKVAYASANCSDLSTCPVFANINNDDAWEVYKTLYLSSKEGVKVKNSDDDASTNKYYNRCIGNSSITSTPSNNTVCQACNSANSALYQYKIIRFPGINDMVKTSIDLYLNSNYTQTNLNTLKNDYLRKGYEKCGKCPNEMYMEGLLASIASKPNNLFLSTITLNTSFQAFSSDVKNIFVNQISGASASLDFTWSLKSRQATSVLINIKQGTTACCTMEFKSANNETVDWDNLIMLSELKSIPSSTNFKIKATLKNPNDVNNPNDDYAYTMDLIVVTSCFNLSCVSSDVPNVSTSCDVTRRQGGTIRIDLLNFLNGITNDKKLVTSTQYDILSKTYYSTGLKNATTQANYWSSSVTTGTSATLAGVFALNSTTKCTLNIVSTNNSGIVFSDILSFSELKANSGTDPYALTTTFTIKARMTSGTLVTLTGSSCFQISNCKDNNQPIVNYQPVGGQATITSTCTTCVNGNCDIPVMPFVFLNTCEQENAQIDIRAKLNAKIAYESYLAQKRKELRAAYIKKCLEAAEKSEIKFTEKEFHYTLYYYDQANNLIATVPPKGVVLYDTTAVRDARAGTGTVTPAHTLVTTYKYNSLNGIIIQQTPDAGISDFYYDRLARLIASRNAKQAVATNTQLSYTLYDELGRIKEIGQLQKTTNGLPAHTNNFVTDAIWTTYITSGLSKSQIVRTYYDASMPGLTTTVSNNQKNLRSRVSSTTYAETDAVVNNIPVYDFASHYSYDVHGNVSIVYQENSQLAYMGENMKTVDYKYDLISGKVNYVYYQKDKADQYIHKYIYDADNRITNVYTSQHEILLSYDNGSTVQDATYFYYKHGPLARTELGALKVQGIDYAYTLQGWLKGVNSDVLKPDFDMGNDGLTTSSLKYGTQHKRISMDVFGYTLGYYSFTDQLVTPNVSYADYKPIGNTATYANQFATITNSPLDAANTSLFNGNIRYMVTTLSAVNSGNPQANMYKYDQLNRLASMYAYENINTSTNVWGTTGTVAINNKYHTEYTYDKNGNITSLRRYDGTSTTDPLDNLTYQYDFTNPTSKTGLKSNRLYHVNDFDPGTTIANASTDPSDIEDQGSFTSGANINTANNYGYDEIGNLIRDASEGISNITWNVYGKITAVTHTTNTAAKPDLAFFYDASGNRVVKIAKYPLNDPSQWKYTYYVRDAHGNVMATYTREVQKRQTPAAGDIPSLISAIRLEAGDAGYKTFIVNAFKNLSWFRTGMVGQVMAGNYASTIINSYTTQQLVDLDDLSGGSVGIRNTIFSNYTDQQLVSAFLNQDRATVSNYILTTSQKQSFVLEILKGGTGTPYCTQFLQNLETYHPGITNFLWTSLKPGIPNPGSPTNWQQLCALPVIAPPYDKNSMANLILSYTSNNINAMVFSIAIPAAEIDRAMVAVYGSYTFIIPYLQGRPNVIAVLISDNPSKVQTIINGIPQTTLLNLIANYDTDNFIMQALGLNIGMAQTVIIGNTAGYTVNNFIADMLTYLTSAQYQAVMTSVYGFAGQYSDNLMLTEVPVYGSSRLGIFMPNTRIKQGDYDGTLNTTTGSGQLTRTFKMYVTTVSNTSFSHTVGLKNYELTNHLGNVLAVVTDKKICGTVTNNNANYYVAEVINQQAYYPFGSVMPGRSYKLTNSKNYRHGFNGKERDQEGMGGGGSTYDYGFRIYNPQLGRFLSVDPLARKFAFYTPYQFAGNKPIACLDLDGLEDIYYMPSFNKLQGQSAVKIMMATELGKKFVSDFQQGAPKAYGKQGPAQENDNRGFDVFVIASNIPADTRGDNNLFWQSYESIVVDGQYCNILEAIKDAREIKSGKVYEELVKTIGEEILFSDEMGETLKNGRGFGIVRINKTDLNVLRHDTKESPTGAKNLAKTLGHELRAHATERARDGEEDPDKDHLKYKNISDDANPESDEKNYEKQVDDVILE